MNENSIWQEALGASNALTILRHGEGRTRVPPCRSRSPRAAHVGDGHHLSRGRRSQRGFELQAARRDAQRRVGGVRRRPAREMDLEQTQFQLPVTFAPAAPGTARSEGDILVAPGLSVVPWQACAVAKGSGPAAHEREQLQTLPRFLVTV
jgi:hypothetical protein